MQKFDTSPFDLAASLWRNRALILALIRREVVGRYRGSVIGMAWSFFNPVFMLAVYTFVFSVVFEARWGGGAGSRTEFALVLFAGLMAFNIFAECVNRAPSLIMANANYVKKVVFPLEILPVVAMGSAFFHGVVSLAVWLLFYLVFFGMPPLTAVLLPIVIMPLLLFTLGVSWLLASLGVYLRDVTQIMGVVTTALMFLSPVFFPVSALPQDYQPWLRANPLTPTIEQVRDVLIWGKVPDLAFLAAAFLGALLMAWLGFAWFQKTRKGFADVL